MTFITMVASAQYNELVYINWTLIAQLLNFVILFFILKHFLYKPIKKMLDSREQEVKKAYDDAQTATDEASKLKASYEEKLASAKEEAQDIIKTATAKAQGRSDEILSDAQQKAASMKQKAEEQIELEKKKALKEIKDDIAELAISAAKQVVGHELEAQGHEQLVEDFIENAGDIKWQS